MKEMEKEGKPARTCFDTVLCLRKRRKTVIGKSDGAPSSTVPVD